MRGIFIFLSLLLININTTYSYTIPVDSADVIINERIGHYALMPHGGMAFGDLDGDGEEDITITLEYGDPFYTISKIYILWGRITDSDSVFVNNYPYIVNDEYYAWLGAFDGVCIYDVNSDGYDDLIYSFPINEIMFERYTSTICVKYGKARMLWPMSEFVTSTSGADLTVVGIFDGIQEGTSLIICNCDDSIGPELISGSSAGTPTGLFLRGHASILVFNTFPVAGTTYIDSIGMCTLYGPTYTPRRPPDDTIPYFGSDMTNLGDLNNDGMDEFSSNAVSYQLLDPFGPLDDTMSTLYFWTTRNIILWGRSRALWRAYNRTAIDLTSDSLLTVIYTYWQGQIAAGDIDGDGYRDLIISDFAMAFCSARFWAVQSDTTKIYIVFGGPGIDSLKGGTFLASDIADMVIKSRFPCDGTGRRTAVGDFNGDGIDDFALVSTNKQDPGIIYVFFGNRERRFPTFMQDAPLKIVDDDTIHFGDTRFDSLFAISFIKMHDLNGDGLDEIIAYNIHRWDYYFNLSGEVNKIIDVGYIFSNRRLSIRFISPDDTILCSSETLQFKINYKYPLKLSSIKVSVNRDTFTIRSPRLDYISTDSLLIILPDSTWDSTKGYWICIQNITDTIGTPPDSLPLCFGFNGATSAVNQPPKPQTLSLTCYPNPFNAEVRIKLRMPDAGDAKIDIYDISGKLIDHIHKSKLTAGWHELVWCPRISVPSGVYLLRVSVGGEVVVRRVMLVR